jgi:HD-GYP domain-containing protein (c-di-GMP phosphodiesterase class II)
VGKEFFLSQPVRVSAHELARWVGLEKVWLERLADTGELPAVHGSAGYAFDPRCLNDWIQTRRPPIQDPIPVDVASLRQVSLALAGGEEPEAVCQSILDRVLAVLGAHMGAIFFAEDNSWLRAVATRGIGVDRPSEVVERIADWVATSGEPLLLPDPRRAADVTVASDPDRPHDVVAVPFLLEGRVLGVLLAMCRRDAPPFTEWHLSLATVLATELALAIERTRVQETLGFRLSSAQRQLEAYAVDVRRTFVAERARTEELVNALEELEMTYMATVQGMAAAVEAKDEYTAGHLARVSRYGAEMLGLLDPEHAADPKMQYGFLLHDIGKLGVPDAILSKEAALTTDEWTLMRRHPEMGVRIISGIPFLEATREIVLSHHERWDGHGYPHRLSGEEIPVGARVFAVADAFDAMTTKRPYRALMPIDVAVAELRRQAGVQFWPDAIDAFLSLPRDLLERTVAWNGRPQKVPTPGRP